MIEFDMSGKQADDKFNEDKDQKLPNIYIKFKVHPVIQHYCIDTYKEAKVALEVIRKEIEPDYDLKKHSIICLFEVGNRKIDDKRLDFESICTAFGNVQKSYLFSSIDGEYTNFAAKIRNAKDGNKLDSTQNYEKTYIIDYGYKYEAPEELYQLQPLLPKEDDKKSEKIISEAVKDKKL